LLQNIIYACRIIPFVAADAVSEDDGDDVDRPTPYSPQGKHRPTDNSLYYKLSHPNRFSPPAETEGKTDRILV
jgi:hypothetical protein